MIIFPDSENGVELNACIINTIFMCFLKETSNRSRFMLQENFGIVLSYGNKKHCYPQKSGFKV